MNKKITSLNEQLAHLKRGEAAIGEAIELYGNGWNDDARRQLGKHLETIKEMVSEYGLDGYEWMFSNDRGML